MSTSTALMTADELLELPRGQHRYELINGELKTMSPASHAHGRIAMRVGASLAQFVWENDLGEAYAAETGFLLRTKPDTVLAPDFAFISKQRASVGRDQKGFWSGPPDVAIEVLSPSESGPQARKKVAEWLGSGAKQVWSINPKNETVTIYRLSGETTTFTDEETVEADDVLPGFRIAVKEIFKQ
jgi:Uma2 family endonuclease